MCVFVCVCVYKKITPTKCGTAAAAAAAKSASVRTLALVNSGRCSRWTNVAPCVILKDAITSSI